jgi:hypothetical protein
MKGLPSLVAFAIFGFAPCAALAEPTPSTATATTLPLTMIGSGAHGYDFLIGRWNCTDSAPYSIYEPLKLSISYGRAGTDDGTLLGIVRSRGYPDEDDVLVAYVPEANVWVMSYGSTEGFRGKEATQEVGQKIIWVGSEGDRRTGSMNSRDTWTFQSLTAYNDLAEEQIHGRWTVVGNYTCGKS